MYPVNSRIRYRDQLDGPIGVIMGHGFSSAIQESTYEVRWSDYEHTMTHTRYFIEKNMEAF